MPGCFVEGAAATRFVLGFVGVLLCQPSLHALDGVLPTVPVGRQIRLEVGLTGLASTYNGHASMRTTEIVPIPDGSGRMVAAQQGGFANVVLSNGAVAPTPFLDLFSTNPNFQVTQAWGFTSIEFHPGFADPNSVGYGKFYTLETETHRADAPYDFVSWYPPPNTVDHLDVFYEYTVNDITSNTFAGSKRRLFSARQPGAAHNFNDMVFGPDGYLYISAGDGNNSSSRPDGAFSLNARRIDNAFGKVLRIDPIDPALTPNSGDAISANGNYRIPASNPFVGDPNPATPQDESLDEVYAYGLRNPYRITVDRENGDIWVGDVGQNSIESIDRIVKGGNYGWSFKEGSFLYDVRDQNNITPDVDANGDGLGDFAAANGLIDPVFEYGRQDGKSVHGGFVYRGSKIPWLRGKYVFGDNYANGTQLFYGDPATGEMFRFAFVAGSQVLGSSITGIAEDENGELLIPTNGGKALRIGCAPPLVPGDLDGSGGVGAGDVALLLTSFGTEDAANICMGDFTGDGAVGVADLAWLQARMAPLVGASPDASTHPVPEPSATCLLGLAGLAFGGVAKVRGRCGRKAP